MDKIENDKILDKKDKKLNAKNIRSNKLIAMGNLVAKAGLEPLKNDTLYGSMIYLKKLVEDGSKEEIFEMIDYWTFLGRKAIENEMGKGKIVILKFNGVISHDVIGKIKNIGLEWNALRKEWEGRVLDINELKKEIKGTEYDIQEI